MTAQKRNILLASTLAVVLASIVATVAVAMSDGLSAGRGHSTGPGTATSSQIATLPAGDISGTVAPNAGSTAILQPYPGPGPFQPGPPPYGQTGVGGDGLSAWGVAFKETSDPAAQPGTDLIKSAYEDAQKKADALASAAGIKLGKLVAISDYTQAQPYFNKLCVQPQLGRPVPAPAQGAPTGSGSGGTGSAPPAQNQLVPATPLPAPSPCPPQRYLVAWVLVRYQIGS
ncbi:MAG TPA: SIMPL domain-containing protein [Candidatus Solibacter sp.]|jgi:hypothetical protein|nr:SIMPL domain-containing protein [Candidatus Solibacter sp.]